MAAASTKVQIWSEFIDPPVPEIETVILSQVLDPIARAAMIEPDFTDQVINLGQFQFGRGTSFATGDDPVASPDSAVPVGKSFEQVEGGRTCLIESVQYPDIEPLLKKLPVTASVSPAPNDKGQLAARLKVVGTRAELLAQLSTPRPPPGRKPEGKILLALGNAPQKPGVTLDYSILSTGTYNNYVFQSDRTTLISGPLTLNGTTVIEGGTVIKFSKGVSAKISITGTSSTIVCLANAYHVATLTASDDNSAGETVTGSSGSPSGYYPSYAISWDASSNDHGLSYLRICYAQTGINYFNANTSGHILSHSTLINCQVAAVAYYNTVTFRNVLAYNQPAYVSGSTFVNGSAPSVVVAENLTIDQVATLRSSSALSMLLTNTLIVGVTSLAGYTAPPNIGTYVVASGTVFQTAGGGSHYLFDNTYRGHGVVTITSSLLSDIRNKTTYPPILISADFTTRPSSHPRPRGIRASPPSTAAGTRTLWTIFGQDAPCPRPCS